MYKLLLLYFLASFAMPASASEPTLAEMDASSVIVLGYSQVGDSYTPDNTISTATFAAHIQKLKALNYSIIPIDSLTNSKKIPPHAVVITLEGGYKSTLHQAIPILLKESIPFTIFYAAEKVESNDPEFMNLEELKTLSKNKNVTLGILPASFSRLIGQPTLEINRQLNKSITLHQEIFGEKPDYFSYPYGEISLELRDIIDHYDFHLALGHQSGPAFSGSDQLAMPRFFLNDDYGNEDHFATILKTLPLPINTLEPRDPLLKTAQPNIGFSLAESLIPQSASLNCFAGDQGQIHIERLGQGRVELRLPASLTATRTHINCIIPYIPVPEEPAQGWRWLGLLFVKE